MPRRSKEIVIKPITIKDFDLYVGLITSDFQVRVRWGYMGFENQWWDQSKWPELLFPNMRVDVNHDWRKNPDLVSAFMVNMKAYTTPDFTRTQADWKAPRPMDYVLATFLIPHGYPAHASCQRQLRATGKIGISIEHGGRKPKRTIGPMVTITGSPWNKDCWMIYGIRKPTAGDSGLVYLYPKFLAESVKLNAQKHLAEGIEILKTKTPAFAAGR